MRSRLRSLLPLTVLVAGPLLGLGGRAQAGYVPQTSLSVGTHADLFGVADAEETESAAADVALPGDDLPTRFEPPGLPLQESPSFGLIPSGAGSQPSPGAGSGAAGSGHVFAVAALPAADPPALVGVLFLESSAHRPPPFPSRLFRPPRLS